MTNEDERGGPVAKAAAAAGGVVLAGGITAVVLITVGASLLIAGLAVLASVLVAGVSLPLIVAGRRAERQVSSGRKPGIVDTHATVRELPQGPRPREDDKVGDVLDRLDAGDLSPDQAVDELE